MNTSIRLLSETALKTRKTIIGLMSGTSLDGLDIALCQIEGSGLSTRVALQQFTTSAYSKNVKKKIKKIVSVPHVSHEELCILHSWLGNYHADLVLEALREWDIPPENIDAIGSHGQTVYHAPKSQHQQKKMPHATLQIGDGDHISRRTGILTISDFRQKNTAAGGEGAPMVAFTDPLLFSDPHSNRLLLNIGGIANFTWLPKSDSKGTPLTADTGPGNTLIDAAMEAYFDETYDEDGKIAAQGTVHPEFLKKLKDHSYFKQKIPKTTGPELFNLDWVRQQQQQAGISQISPEDLVATLTWFTAETISDAIKNIAGEDLPEIYVSGGGMHNNKLVQWLSRLLDGTEIFSFEKIGFNPDAKEAVSFAVLANETLSGKGFFMDPKQNAGRRVNFGKISLPV